MRLRAGVEALTDEVGHERPFCCQTAGRCPRRLARGTTCRADVYPAARLGGMKTCQLELVTAARVLQVSLCNGARVGPGRCRSAPENPDGNKDQNSDYQSRLKWPHSNDGEQNIDYRHKWGGISEVR